VHRISRGGAAEVGQSGTGDQQMVRVRVVERHEHALLIDRLRVILAAAAQSFLRQLFQALAAARGFERQIVNATHAAHDIKAGSVLRNHADAPGIVAPDELDQSHVVLPPLWRCAGRSRGGNGTPPGYTAARESCP
jgi:hypothetical protein